MACMGSAVRVCRVVINKNQDPILLDNNIDNWIKKISFLLENEKRRLEFGKKAHLISRKYFSKDKVLEEFDKFLKKIF